MIELLIAMAITIVIMASALTLYRKSMDAVMIVSQRTEMQANARSGINNIVRDLSQAGSSGVPWGGISLPNCKVSPCGLPLAFFAHDSTGASYLTANTFSQRQMYMVTPSYQGGPTINVGRANPSDGIAILYVDQRLNTSDPPAAPGSGGGWTVTPASTISTAGDSVTMPPNMVPAINDPVSGVNQGDLMMLTNTNGSVVGIVTSASGSNPIAFTDGDPLNMNQSTANSGNIASLATAGAYPSTTLQRLYLISYFIEPLDSNGNVLALNTTSAVDGRLMRQVNTSAPVPVAEHIIALNFSYDLSDPDTAAFTSNVPAATLGAPASPAYNQIRNVYVSVTARSSRPDRNGSYSFSTLNTNVSPRNLVFRDTFK